MRRFLLVAVLSLFVVVGCGGEEAPTGNEKDEQPEGAPVNGYDTHPARILIDESSEDWADHPVLVSDSDDAEGEIDLEDVRVAHSEQYLFLQIEVGEPINLQENNDLTLHLDTDNDPASGRQRFGLGAEVTWTFGERSGQAMVEGNTEEIGHADLGIATLPTVQSETFEIALDRSATPVGSTPLFPNDTLRIALSNDGDRIPDEDGGIGYVLSDTDLEAEAPTITESAADAVRILSYNLLRDTLLHPASHPRFERILRAIGPDVVGFQEVYEHSAEETGRSVAEAYAEAEGWEWSKAGRDLVVGSRYPILETHEIPGYEGYRSAAALLDAEEGVGSNLLFIVMHPPCCNFGPEDGDPSSNAQRQLVVDGVVAFIRDLRNGEGPFELAHETPIVVAGDMNFVGAAQQPQTLRTGEIVNTDRFGSGAVPDWDESPLLDTKPQQTATPLHITWADAESSFPPGRLDYAYISDSVLEVRHKFVLHTPSLSQETRSQHGLQADDTREASDHLPVVIDVAAP